MTSILEEAAAVRRDRAARVDAPEGNFARIAAIWSVVFGHPVTTKQVALAMIGLKLARECYKPWRDNLVDLAGYADCADEIEQHLVADDDQFDPIAELYAFRQQCQEERENADTNETADGDRRPPSSGNGSRGKSPEGREVCPDSGDRHGFAGAEYRHPPTLPAWGTHDSGP